MTPEHMESFRANLDIWLQGNAAAVDYCMCLLKIADTWDDLIDEDHVAPERTSEAFEACLLNIPENPFFAVHCTVLVPLHRNIILQWYAANEFEARKESLEKAYMLRAGIYQIFGVCASLIGGMEWGRRCSPEIWRLYGEKFDDFRKEIEDA
jgi:hypothetical protein